MSEQNNRKDENQEDNFIRVAVVTTAGAYPYNGFEKVPVHQKVRVFIDKATKELGITDYSNWIAKFGNNTIDVEKNYEENGLSGEVEIDFGPVAGGGGNA